ncbi:MAG: DNA repair protein RadA, partial [Acidimicrobiales bacterium]|nr:DNA repair protein RadA [Acidimicrobiales bacterium]
FGPTHELGLFQMSDQGLLGVPDPSGLFLSDRRRGVPGSVVVPTLDGHRPLLVEIQALVTGSDLGNPRRSAQGVDGGRLNMVLAVLEERAGISVARSDVYALAAGGLRVTEPGADLALALAVVTAATDTPLADGVVVCAELGLGGELRQVSRLDRRLAEAARLGFATALVAPDGPEAPSGLRTVPAATLAEAVRHCHGGALGRPLRAV